MKKISDKIVLHLSLIKEIGDNTIQSLLENLSLDVFSNLYKLRVEDLLNLGVSYQKATAIAVGLRDVDLLNRELDLIAKHEVKWITILDDSYPKLLQHIQGSPSVLYWQGDLKQWPPTSIAVVGSRKANHYGKSVINEVVPKLVSAGYAIVSGGAFGADAMAHQVALDAGGVTIAVCGTGLVHRYPKAHSRLYKDILASGGAIVSVFPMNTPGHPANFPKRNRIISGLSHGCLVVQAAAKSGAKITANLALEQGREVFVIPGLFGDSLSAGCHSLAQEGAKVVHSVEDILAELPGGDTFVEDQPISFASEVDAMIVGACRYPISTNDLQGQLSIDIADLQIRLFDLQLQGHIKQNFAGLWEK